MVDIPGFPVHELEFTADGWVIRNKRTKRILPGAAREGRARRFNLRGTQGYANRTLDGWLKHCGLDAGTPEGVATDQTLTA